MAHPTPAQALWNQREQLAAAAGRLRNLIAAVGRPTDLCPFQWAEVIAFALEFRPDLILELGRGRGNSTCCFLETASWLRDQVDCKVVSLCLSDDWFRLTLPRLTTLCSPDWYEPARICQCDIRQFDFGPVLEQSQRCLVFWDAHGFDIAEQVLGNLLPQLANKTHVVLMHDLCDLRYCAPPREYGDCGLWKGENATEPCFWLGHIYSRVAQAISIVDFTTRNRLPLHSADESLHEELGKDPAKKEELERLLTDFFSLQAHWFWFSLNEAPGTVTFPHCQKEEASFPPPHAERGWRPRGVRHRVRRALAALWA